MPPCTGLTVKQSVIKRSLMKQQTEKHAIGIDISKTYFDAAVIVEEKTEQGQFDNTKTGFRAFQ
jgi:hypothetical protein